MVQSGLVEDERSSGLLDDIKGAFAELNVRIGGVSQRLDDEAKERRRVNAAIYTIPDIPQGQITAATGAGSSLKLPDISGPKTGQVWFVTRVSVQGMTAGSINVCYLDPGGTQVDQIFFVATSPLTHFYSGTQFPVRPGQWLAFAAGSGFTGTATVSIGVTNVAAEYEGLYLL